MEEIKITKELAEVNPQLKEGDVINVGGGNCPLPAPTTPPPGYSFNSTRYCENGEWKWINGVVA